MHVLSFCSKLKEPNKSVDCRDTPSLRLSFFLLKLVTFFLSKNTVLFIPRVSHLLSYPLPSNIDACLIVHASPLSCYSGCVYMDIS